MSDQIPEGVDLNTINQPGVYRSYVGGDTKLPEPIPVVWGTTELFGYLYGTWTMQGLTTHWMKKLPDGEWNQILPPKNPHPNGPRLSRR